MLYEAKSLLNELFDRHHWAQELAAQVSAGMKGRLVSKCGSCARDRFGSLSQRSKARMRTIRSEVKGG